MDNAFWIKQTHFKLFGLKIFSKEEIIQEGQAIQIQIKQDYFNSEFDLNKKDNNDGRK